MLSICFVPAVASTLSVQHLQNLHLMWFHEVSSPQPASLQMPEPAADGRDTTDVMVLELKTEAIMLCCPDLGHNITTLAYRQVNGIMWASTPVWPSSNVTCKLFRCAMTALFAIACRACGLPHA